MPYIDENGVHSGWSLEPQPGLGLVDWVDEPPQQPVPVPGVVSRFQGREAMRQTPHGDVSLFEAAEAIINSESTPATYRRAWADLQEFRRDSEMLLVIATALGLDAAAVDRLFILAGSIQA
ncbi:hypothetical protein AKG08_17460 [Achromobacter piechaudii]|uniref:hypothetical protein n=1 Tax=Achromobacter piechaudii TaxID=72556 RepID=UPI0006803A95|nr:hypothetical protein [Achromobacter piechaudii]KNY09428.1 hypothetical protein AKG08_17460 [Achromobacter piechaudii]